MNQRPEITPKDEVKKIASQLYFSIAIIKECNYKCGYCYPFGQNKTIGINMSAEEFLFIVESAIEVGFNKFKISGGEPTLVNWLFEKIGLLLDMHNEISFTIITNGKNLKKNLDFLEQRRDNVGIQFSLDLASHQMRDGFYKTFNPETENLLENLSKRKIKTRINMVVTKHNMNEIDGIINLARRFGFTVKLFNLFLQNQYIATDGINNSIGKYSSLSPLDYWKEEYVKPDEVLKYLKVEYGARILDSPENEGFGSLQRTLEVNGVRVILLNSAGGAFFNPDICINKCPFFGKTCEKGMFNPLVSSNMVLHIDDCNNSKYRWDLRGKSRAEMISSINSIIELFSNIKFVEKPLSFY